MDKFGLILAAIVITSYNEVVLGNVAPGLIPVCRNPNYIHACPGLKSDCLKKTIQDAIPEFVKGIPEFDIIPLDPLHQERVRIDLPGGLKIELNDGSVYGLRKCIIDSVKYENAVADLNLHCNLTVKGQYKASGRILIITINGEGDAKIRGTNIIIKCKIKFEDVVRDGIVYHEIKHLNVRYIFGDRITFDLSNLFKGSPEISETVLNFLNMNWKQVADEFADPIVKTVVSWIEENIKKFFSRVPKDEIIIPE